MRVITLSASYGCGGSVVGPELARRLGVPFVDRAVSSRVAEELDVSEEEVEAGEVRRSWLERMAFSMSPLAGEVGAGLTVLPLSDEQSLRDAGERVLREAVRDGGVVLGRAGAWALAGIPGVVRVRLFGDPERRVAQAVRVEGVDEETARRRLKQVDRARADYARRLYGARVDDVDVYDLHVDSTRLPLDRVVDLLVAAAGPVS